MSCPRAMVERPIWFAGRDVGDVLRLTRPDRVSRQDCHESDDGASPFSTAAVAPRSYDAGRVCNP